MSHPDLLYIQGINHGVGEFGEFETGGLCCQFAYVEMGSAKSMECGADALIVG